MPDTSRRANGAEAGASPAVEGGSRGSKLDPRQWEWRQRVRENPRTRGPYRIGVGVVGGLLIVAAGLTGWLPGPGGIPLALVGLAVLASEFNWAKRILEKCNQAYRRFTEWAGRQPGWLRVTGGGLLILLVLAVIAYGVSLTSGVPSFLPRAAGDVLRHLPGVH